jgi:DNA-binding SARP family transcriptional activator
MWLERTMPPTPDWVGVICQATRKDPIGAKQAAEGLPGPTGDLAAGLAALLTGQLQNSHTLLMKVAENGDASAPISAGAWLAAGIAGLLAGIPHGADELRAGTELAEHLGLAWLARLGSCAEQCLDTGTPNKADPSLVAAEDADDLWGAALIGLLQGFGWQRQPQAAREAFGQAADRFRKLGASVLEAWARAGSAVAAARAGHADAGTLAARADASARVTSTWAALVGTCHAYALLKPGRAEEYMALSEQVDAECPVQLVGGVRLLPPREPQPEAIQAAPAVLECLGEFTLTFGDRAVDLSEVKPRVRSLLRLLALHVGRFVHREKLIEALWPEANTRTGTRNLQVAISAARQLLEHVSSGQALVEREGDAYRLALPSDTEVDLHCFERALDQARQARADGDRLVERSALGCCLKLYRGDLLAVEGPAEWVIESREHYRVLAADVTEALANACLDDGELAEAARVCERGLTIDRYRDGLWRLQVKAHERGGDLAAASLTRRHYAEVLDELGVSPSSTKLSAAS